MQTKSLLALTALTLAALAVLIGLGVWQVQRLHWKEGLIADIEARTKAAPITLAEAVAIAKGGRDPSYYRVTVAGRFDHAKELYLYAVSEGRAGWHVITPLKTEDGAVVLVDRGFVPEALRDPASRPKGELGGVVTVTGIVHVPEAQGAFTPDSEVGANRWFWRDLHAMARAAGTEVAPFFLDAEKSEIPGGWPEGGQTRLELPNNHLQYAITWFLLAAALLLVYAIFLRSAFRPRTPLG
ncbi:MAG TPA: SURF1 family protein [Methyloceanibacter sp.]|jgi:surfeit locus 1 family protein|nr:SURF1 family protein [Methyloceanibacter sp.]